MRSKSGQFDYRPHWINWEKLIRLPQYLFLFSVQKAVFICLFVQVEWDVEKPCFETFARETADFCAVKAKWLSSSTDDETEQQVVAL